MPDIAIDLKKELEAFIAGLHKDAKELGKIIGNLRRLNIELNKEIKITKKLLAQSRALTKEAQLPTELPPEKSE